MTADRKRKQAVRRYQAEHPGMTYTQALRIVLRERDQRRAAERKAERAADSGQLSRPAAKDTLTTTIGQDAPSPASEHDVPPEAMPPGEMPLFLEPHFDRS